MSTQFLPVSMGSSGFKAERLFKAAVSAFCSLTRPSRSEAAQLDDLALPLLPLVSPEARRFAAAALSECRQSPAGLVRRLADEPVGICAPLLVRSRTFSDIDLIGLIGRHGLPHALVIARRRDLNPGILEIVRALLAASGETAILPPPPPRPESRAEEVRGELRAIMRPAAPQARAAVAASGGFDWAAAAAAHPRLLSTAMTGRRPLFQTALADVLEIDFANARAIVDAVDGKPLVAALRALGFSAGDAFLLFALAYPGGFSDMEAVRGFVDGFQALPIDDARQVIERMRVQAGDGPRPDAANDADPHPEAAARISSLRTS